MKTIRVLYLHAAPHYGGSSRSLIEMYRAFPVGSVLGYMVAASGSAADAFIRTGMELETVVGLTQFDNTRYGYYRGLRWFILMREIAFIFPTFLALLRARKKWRDIDLIHANEITLIFSAWMAKCIFRKPLVIHTRSVQAVKKIPRRMAIVFWVVRKFVDQLVVIDDTVCASLPARVACDIVRNGFWREQDSENIKQPVEKFSSERPMRIAMVGSLHPMKGIYEFVDAAAICCKEGFSMEFWLIGTNNRSLKGLWASLLSWLGFAHDVESDVRARLNREAIEGYFRLLGFADDIASIYRQIDLVCFPSHLDAVGRPVFEAAFYKVPAIVAITNPESDTFMHGKTGLRVVAGDSKGLAEAMRYFYDQPYELLRMGENAHRLAEQNFEVTRNAARMLDIYRRLVLGPSGSIENESTP